ncbi:hypothetical protein B0T18DRAFT_389406 [Schizothecium vesticola]|uniref:Uncharacterized protein n=1 Tax=Schizothecium vesticola TaxID=314040 RepID=A0AA40F292_9PEZI|nr:hypothetical protein B0T18DRAFT_389406 [Schizothecium vesticola]
MYLPTRDDTAAPACETTPLQKTKAVLGYFGWTFFFFLLVAFIWLLHKCRTAAHDADQLREERDSLSDSIVRQMNEIEFLHRDLDTNNYLLAIAKENAAKLRRDQVFVVGDDSDSDSDSDNDSVGGGSDSLDVTANTGSVFSTSLRPAPARTPTPTPTRTPTSTRAPTPTRALTPAPVPTPSEQSGGAKTPGSPSTAGETTENGPQKEAPVDESVSRPASPEFVTSVSQRSLAYELAVAQAGQAPALINLFIGSNLFSQWPQAAKNRPSSNVPQ